MTLELTKDELSYLAALVVTAQSHLPLNQDARKTLIEVKKKLIFAIHTTVPDADKTLIN